MNTAHPVLFDHPVDHVPGMLMVEAARQAARAVAPHWSLPVALDCSFARYAELDAPCWVGARAAGRAPTAAGRWRCGSSSTAGRWSTPGSPACRCRRVARPC
ncbi:AfsA-related hotdog domain-containing protein [Streptomyces albulus]|nr:AfsA-related hotdog domain-containing protein [Streptomyces noursei]